MITIEEDPLLNLNTHVIFVLKRINVKKEIIVVIHTIKLSNYIMNKDIKVNSVKTIVKMINITLSKIVNMGAIVDLLTMKMKLL